MFVCPECGTSSGAGGFCTEDGVRLEGSNDPMLGRTLGSYRVAQLIGAGGMGRVYKGVHPGIGSRVAIKVMSPEYAGASGAIERFFAEARAVNVVRHEHIVNIIDLSLLPEGQPYIVMEYLDGQPLSSLIAHHGALPLGSVLRLISEVLDALAAAHHKDVIHRDLKPDNIIVSPSGHAKVLDFGVAKLKPEISKVDGATRTGSLLGTPHYMSPEQARGQHVDARADLYSVGVILYECASGKKPFDGDVLYELLRQHIEVRPTPPSQLCHMPAALDMVIQRALEKDPGMRFQSAGEFRQALDQAAAFLSPDSYAPLSATMPSPGHAARGGPLPQTALDPTVGGTRASASANHASAHPSSFAGYANTLGPPGNTAPPPPKSGGGQLVYFIVGTLGVLLLGGMATLVAIVYLGTRVASETPHSAGYVDNSSDDDSTRPGSAVPTGPALPNPMGTGAGGIKTPKGTFNAKPPSFDSKSFDVWAYYPTAESLAKSHYADAGLVRIDIMGVRKNGIVDFSLSGDFKSSVLYRFRSPSHSIPPPSFPKNASYEGDCRVYVTAGEDGISDYVLDKWSCEEKIVKKPRCSPSQIWARAEQNGAPGGNVIGNLSYWADDNGRGRWLVDIKPFSKFMPDDC